MSTRKQAINRYELWLSAERLSGEPRMTYGCPYCKHKLVTLKPAAGVTWDSFSTCPYCGGTFFKVVSTDHKGEAEVTTNIVRVEKESLIGREVTMVIEPGMQGIGCTTGNIVFAEPYAECDTLFLMESDGLSGHKLFTLASAEAKTLIDEPDGRFDNVCMLASSEAGHCAGLAKALRLLADKFDALELANAAETMPTKLDA